MIGGPHRNASIVRISSFDPPFAKSGKQSTIFSQLKVLFRLSPAGCEYHTRGRTPSISGRSRLRRLPPTETGASVCGPVVSAPTGPNDERPAPAATRGAAQAYGPLRGT